MTWGAPCRLRSMNKDSAGEGLRPMTRGRTHRLMYVLVSCSAFLFALRLMTDWRRGELALYDSEAILASPEAGLRMGCGDCGFPQ